MKKYGLILFLVLSASYMIHAGSLPELINPQDYDSEYELDLLQNYFAPAWIWEWLEAENAFRITGGSLNIRHIYHDRYLKLRFPMIENRLWFRYAHAIRQVIEDEWQSNEIELEYSPLKNLFLSILGDPVYHKSEIDVGAAVRYGAREDNSIKISYILVDYDNNYAYRNESVNEGFEQFYRDFPLEWRVKAVTAVLPVKLWVEGRYRGNWKREFFDFNDPAENAAQSGREYSAEGEIRWDREAWSPYIDFFGRFTGESEFFIIPRPAEDHTRWEKRMFVRPHVLMSVSDTHEIDGGCALVKHDGEDVFAGFTKAFDNRNIMPFIIWRWHIYTLFSMETGYMHGTIDERRMFNATISQNIKRENRLRLALDLKFTKNTRLKIISGWDLDREDWGKFAIFDGGYVQFQTAM